MTSKEIDKLEAGRKLDLLIAEKVMEWTNATAPLAICCCALKMVMKGR